MKRFFHPKLFTVLKEGYSWEAFRKDLLAGLTVGIIALPLAMALGIASGVTPERGLITAIVAGFLISFFGGSRIQIGGPTGAFVILVYEIVERSGYEGLAAATLVASILLVLMGLFRLGSWIRFVPESLIVGFTAGIGVLIFSSQVKDFLGLSMARVPAHFIPKWKAYWTALPTIAPATLLFSLTVLALILLSRKRFPKIPWAIVAICASTLIVFFLHLPVETIASRFGRISNEIPPLSLPGFPLERAGEVLLDGVAIAFLGAIESLLSCAIGDRMIQGNYRPNTELIGQGIANFFSVLFGGIPATGAIARTAASARSGARSPVAGIIHAIVLLLIFLFLSQMASLVPLAALSAILIVVAWNMSDFPEVIRSLKESKREAALLLTGFFLTIFVDISSAIAVGVLLSLLPFMKKRGEEKRGASEEVP